MLTNLPPHNTPASSVCKQLCSFVFGQVVNCCSVPEHWKLLACMGSSVAFPNAPNDTAIAPVMELLKVLCHPNCLLQDLSPFGLFMFLHSGIIPSV